MKRFFTAGLLVLSPRAPSPRAPKRTTVGPAGKWRAPRIGSAMRRVIATASYTSAPDRRIWLQMRPRASRRRAVDVRSVGKVSGIAERSSVAACVTA